MDKSKERAYEILEQYIASIKKTREDIIRSVVLVGSLSDDSYTGNAGSDIDLVHILNDEAPQSSRQTIMDLIKQTEIASNNDIPISKCIYRYRDLFKPYPVQFKLCQENKDYLELPIEILRIKDSGIIIWGEDIRDVIDTPTKEDIIQFMKLSDLWRKSLAIESPDWYAGYLKMCKTPTIQILTQIIITTAMLDYYFATGKSCSSKAKIAKLMQEHVPAYKFQSLLNLCTKWRYSPQDITPDDEEFMQSEYQVWRSERKEKSLT